MSAPRVLLVRFSAIGDCAMAAWAATAVRERHPDAFLCWAVESRCAPVLDRTALVSHVEEIPRERWKRHRWSPAMWRQQIAKYAGLRRLRFDFGLDLQGHSKTALCLRLARPARRLAVPASDPFAARLNPTLSLPSGVHTIEGYGALLGEFGDFTIPERPLMPHDPEAARTLAERLGGERPLATISVSAGSPDKAYPEAGWTRVAEGLLARGYRVAFLGGPNDRAIPLPETVDLVGKLALSSTIEAIRLSALHLAADTGNGHLAAAVGVPVVSVFGPTNPAVYRPYTPDGRVLREGRATADVAPEAILGAARELGGR